MFYSFAWGIIADAKGKKFTIALTALCLTTTTLAFGFSNNLYWAIITRLLQGCCMGMNVAVKALLCSICDDSNIAMGMTIITSSYSVGLIVGPSCAGKFEMIKHTENF